MLKAIKDFFDQHISVSDAQEIDPEHRLRVACAALLLEISRADFSVHGDELSSVAAGIKQKFELSDNETQALVDLAEEESQQATCYYEFTSLINQAFSYEQKLHLLELMWEVAYADQYLDKYEEALLRKIADLLYIRHPDFIAVKHKVQP